MKLKDSLFLFALLVITIDPPAFSEDSSVGPRPCGLAYLMEVSTDYTKGVTFQWGWPPGIKREFHASYGIDVPFADWEMDNAYSLPPNTMEATFSTTVGTHTFYLLGLVEPGYWCGEARTFFVPIASTPPSTVSGKPSAALMEKIDVIKKIVLTEKGEDHDSVVKLRDKLYGYVLPYEKSIYRIIKNKKTEWRVRYLCALSVSGSVPVALRGEWYSTMGEILNDARENMRFREEVSLLLRAAASPKNAEIRKAIEKAIKKPKFSRKVMQNVLWGIKNGGVADVDYLISMYRWDKRSSASKPNEISAIEINRAVIMGAALSKSPAAIDFLFKAFAKTDCKNCVLPAFRTLLFEDTATQAIVRDRMIPILLEWYRRPKSDHQTMDGFFALFKATEAVNDILSTLKPMSEGGDWRGAAIFATDALAEIGDKKAIPQLEKLFANFTSDSRWSDIPKNYPDHKFPGKFPDDVMDYRVLKWNIEKLKGNNPGPRPYPRQKNWTLH